VSAENAVNALSTEEFAQRPPLSTSRTEDISTPRHISS
jgi:hypothetical protein